GRLRQQGSSLQAEERTRFGLELADMMFADGRPDQAFQTLSEILPDVESDDVGPERRHQFWELQARCLQALGPSVDTRLALERADSALRDLLARQAGSGNDIDVVALAMSRAELLHLDERASAAMEQFEIVIRPRLDRLDLPTRLAVEQNHIDLRIDPIGPDTA